MKKGRLIAIYGVNNVGKTTHAKRLVQSLRKHGVDAVYIKYPRYSVAPSGPFLNSVLRNNKKQHMPEEELQLWFVLNRFQFEPKLMSLLRGGKTVVAEDYTGTGIAWGAAKGASQKELERMNTFFVQPDVSILMDGKRRHEAVEKNHIHEQNDVLVRKCARILRALAKKYGWKTVLVDDDIRVTAKRVWNVTAGGLA